MGEGSSPLNLIRQRMPRNRRMPNGIRHEARQDAACRNVPRDSHGGDNVPSVFVTWKGQCSDRNVQTKLLSFLKPLADRSAARLSAPLPLTPAFLEGMLEREKQQQLCFPVLPFVINYNQSAHGMILVDTDLMLDEGPALVEAQRCGIRTLPKDPDGERRYLQLDRLDLYGIEFQVFDPRSIYVGDDRISFVFLRSHDAPFLNGCVAMVQNKAICQRHRGVIRSADWYVSMPCIHLRYFLEEWSDMLLGWVKHYFVPNLYYCRNDPLSNFETLRTSFAETDGRAGGDGRALVFASLVERFEKEADEWLRQMSGGEKPYGQN